MKENLEETVYRYDFKIIVKESDLKASEIKSKLVKIRFHRYNSERDEFDNPIYNFINYSFNRHFKFLGDSKAYLSNYEEKEGSLEITFIVLLITSYGGIRETIDYFTDDLETFFRSSNGLAGHVKYEKKTPQKFKKLSKIYNRDIDELKRNISGLRKLCALLFFILIASCMYMISLNDKIIDSGKILEIVNERIEKNNSEMKLDYIFKSQSEQNKKSKEIK